MKKLFMAAALTIAFASYGQAAPAKSEFCKMANSQRNTPSWNEHYGCLKEPVRQARVAEAVRAKPAKNQYCGMANSQRNTPSWNEYYGCLH
jgi:hypothetical protein